MRGVFFLSVHVLSVGYLALKKKVKNSPFRFGSKKANVSTVRIFFFCLLSFAFGFLSFFFFFLEWPLVIFVCVR